MSLLGNIVRWFRLQLGPRPTAHVQAEVNTLLSWQLGDRCIYCSARPIEAAWRLPCPRKLPSQRWRELA